MRESKAIRIKASGRSKYRAIKTVCGEGHRHDSKKEAKVCDDLTLMAKGGVIHDLEQQPEYELLAYDPKHGHGVIVGKYRADFRYKDLDSTVVLDVKGMRTPMFLFKKKMMKACWGIEVQEA
jgi:hypothetical protein